MDSWSLIYRLLVLDLQFMSLYILSILLYELYVTVSLLIGMFRTYFLACLFTKPEEKLLAPKEFF